MIGLPPLIAAIALAENHVLFSKLFPLLFGSFATIVLELCGVRNFLAKMIPQKNVCRQGGPNKKTPPSGIIFGARFLVISNDGFLAENNRKPEETTTISERNPGCMISMK